MGEPRWSDSARVVNSSIMEQIQLLDLTSDVMFNIISILKTMDIFGMLCAVLISSSRTSLLCLKTLPSANF